MTKRRSPGRGNIEPIKLRSGKRSYRGSLTVGYRIGEDGKKRPIRRTVQAPTKAEVEQGLDALRARYRVGVDLDAERMRLSTLNEKWLAVFEAVENPPARTMRTYRWAARRICAALGDPLVVKVGALQLQEKLIELAEELSQSSLSKIAVALNAAFQQAVSWKIRPDNPAEHLKVPKAKAKPKRKGRALTPEEVQRFREALSGERLEFAVLIALAYGLRRGEVPAIRDEQIDLEAGTITIDAQHQPNLQTGKIDREDTKGGDTRVFRIDEWFRLAYARHKARRATERRLMGAQWTAPDEGLLFVSSTDGGRLDGDAIYDVVTRVAARAGLGKVTPHDLRRTLQSLLGKEGVDRNVRAAIAGHTDATTTERHYRVVYDDEGAQALTNMARILGLDMPAAEGETDAS